MNKILCMLICLLMIITSFIPSFAKEENQVPSMKISTNMAEIKISAASKKVLPKFVKKVLEENPDYKLNGFKSISL